MIDAAERIAAEQGLAAMSLRAVQVAAGQRNKSAAQYHFGTREGLVEAVLAARMAPLGERRLDMLVELDAAAGLRELVEVLVRPVAEAVLGSAESHWARFVMQGFTDPSIAEIVRTHLAGRGFRAMQDRILAQLGDLPPRVRARRFEQAVGVLFLTLAGLEGARSRRSRAEVERVTADLVNVCTAVLQAPSGSGAAGEPQR